MTMTFDETSMIRSSTLRCAGCRACENRVQRRDDRHGQPRQQRHDVAAGLAAEYAELMLQRYDVVMAGIQEVGRRCVFFELARP